MSEPIVEPPLIPTPEALVQLAIERLQATYPNFNPNPASPEWRMFLAFAAIAAETIILAFDVPEAIIRFVGAVVYQEPPTPATYATCESTWVALDDLGHEIPAGNIVLLTPEDAGPVEYEVTEEVVIAVDATEAIVPLRAVEAGAQGNISVAFSVAPQEALGWLSEITVGSPPAGGAEEESLEEYSRRILELAKLIAPRPILPEDFANYVRLLTTTEHVARAVAIDGLQLVTEGGHTKINDDGEGEVEAEKQERCVTIIAVNDESKHLSDAAREEAEAKLEAGREATFLSFVAGPTVHMIDIEVVGVFFRGYEAAGVEANLEAASKALISPATWGVPQTGDTRGWINKTTLRYQDVVAAVNSAVGFNYYTTLKVNGGTADVDLTGIAPLPELGTVTISLTEGSE